MQETIQQVTFASERAQRVQENSLRPTNLVSPGSVVSLAVGQPDQPMSRVLADSLSAAIDAGYTRYPNGAGDLELREEIAKTTQSKAIERIDSSNVFITHGGAAAITTAILGLVNPGDKVVIPEPTYSLYQDAVLLAGGRPVYLPLGDGGTLPLQRIQEEAPSSKLVIICSPGNPTGAVITRSQYKGLVEALSTSQAKVLVDEAYADLTYDENFFPAVAVPGLFERLVLVKTFSKSYCMTGLRLGWITADARTLSPIKTVHRTVNGGVNSAVQRMGITALQNHQELIAPLVEAYRQRRNVMETALQKIPDFQWSRPSGAFYFFVKYSWELKSTDVVSVLSENGVAVRAGREFGPSGEGHLRLSFAAHENDIKEGVFRIMETLPLLHAR